MSSSRTLFHLWCVLVVFSSHTHIGYGARTDLRRSSNLYKDRHIQPSDAEYFNPEPLDGTSVEKWSNKEEGKRDNSVVRVSRSTKGEDGQAICGKKSSGGVEWSCINIISCRFTEKLSTEQRTVCGGEGSSQKICCPYRIDSVKVAQKKCEEYESETRSTRKTREVSIPQVPQVRNPLDKPTNIEEFPHMALIGSKNADDPTSSEVQWNCGGSLISHQYILTAAHCNNTKFAALTPTWVVLGNTTKPSNNESELETKDNVYRILKPVKYPGYNLSKFDNDIALFKLNRSVKFSRHIGPACLALPPNVKYNAGLAIVTGWGRTEANGIPSEKLLEASISVLKNSTCEEAFKNETTMLSKGFDAISMICAGNVTWFDGGTCSGDSGGPLQYRIDDSSTYGGMWFQEGITSFGKQNCEDPEPKIFTRVSHFLPWIQSIVWPTEDLI